MWPSFNDGDVIDCEAYSTQEIEVEDLVVFLHLSKECDMCEKSKINS